VTSDIIYIDIRTSSVTMGGIVDKIASLQKAHPDQEIFMDGDAYAIVGRQRKVSA